MYSLFLGKRLDLLISEFSNSLSWGTNYSLGGESALLVSCFLIHIWGCFSTFGKQLDLLGAKFSILHFWEMYSLFLGKRLDLLTTEFFDLHFCFFVLGNDLINQKKSRSSNSSWEASPVAGRLVSTFHLAMHSSWGENDHCWLVILRFEHSNIASVGLTLLPSLLKAFVGWLR